MTKERAVLLSKWLVLLTCVGTGITWRYSCIQRRQSPPHPESPPQPQSFTEGGPWTVNHIPLDASRQANSDAVKQRFDKLYESRMRNELTSEATHAIDSLMTAHKIIDSGLYTMERLRREHTTTHYEREKCVKEMCKVIGNYIVPGSTTGLTLRECLESYAEAVEQVESADARELAMKGPWTVKHIPLDGRRAARSDAVGRLVYSPEWEKGASKRAIEARVLLFDIVRTIDRENLTKDQLLKEINMDWTLEPEVHLWLKIYGDYITGDSRTGLTLSEAWASFCDASEQVKRERTKELMNQP